MQINGEDVRQASHETVVNLIRKSGDLVALTVVTILPQMCFNNGGSLGDNSLLCSTSSSPLPSVMSMSISTAPVPGTISNSNTSNQPRQYSTLPRKLHGSGKLQIQPPPPPKRDPNTTLSVGKARARSMVANLAAIGNPKFILHCYKERHKELVVFLSISLFLFVLTWFRIFIISEALDKAISEHDFTTNESLTESVNSAQGMPDLLETTKPAIGDLIDLNSIDRSKNKVYGSVAEMKRCKVKIIYCKW